MDEEQRERALLEERMRAIEPCVEQAERRSPQHSLEPRSATGDAEKEAEERHRERGAERARDHPVLVKRLRFSLVRQSRERGKEY